MSPKIIPRAMSNPATETLVCEFILIKSWPKVLPANAFRKFRELFELNLYKIFILFVNYSSPGYEIYICKKIK